MIPAWEGTAGKRACNEEDDNEHAEMVVGPPTFMLGCLKNTTKKLSEQSMDLLRKIGYERDATASDWSAKAPYRTVC